MGLFSDIFHMNLGKYFKPNSTNNWNSLKNSKKKPQNLLHLVNKINSFDIEIGSSTSMELKNVPWLK